MTALRLLPVLLLAASALLTLKLAGLVLDPDGLSTGGVGVAMAQTETDAGESVVPSQDVSSGDVDGAPADESGGSDPLPEGGLTVGRPGNPGLPGGLELGGSIAERKVLESLSGRRQELDQRERQFELRQKILDATEQRLQKKVEEIRALEARIAEQREAEAQKREGDLRNLVLMYESMKAKDAARIFDRLDLDIALKVAKQMKPRKMADIMARMSPDASERLTIALVRGRDAVVVEAADTGDADALPKIMGN